MRVAELREIKYQYDDGLFVALQSKLSALRTGILSQGTAHKDPSFFGNIHKQLWPASTHGTLWNSQHHIIHKFHLSWKVLGLFGGHSDSPAFFHSQDVPDAMAGRGANSEELGWEQLVTHRELIGFYCSTAQLGNTFLHQGVHHLHTVHSSITAPSQRSLLPD